MLYQPKDVEAGAVNFIRPQAPGDDDDITVFYWFFSPNAPKRLDTQAIIKSFQILINPAPLAPAPTNVSIELGYANVTSAFLGNDVGNFMDAGAIVNSRISSGVDGDPTTMQGSFDAPAHLDPIGFVSVVNVTTPLLVASDERTVIEIPGTLKYRWGLNDTFYPVIAMTLATVSGNILEAEAAMYYREFKT